MIFYYAFQPKSIIGGTFGEFLKIAITQGAKRGLFSNEAVMGSIPHAHVQANVYSLHEQGVVAMIGVFFDTLVVLTLNVLVIIATLYTSDGIFSKRLQRLSYRNCKSSKFSANGVWLCYRRGSI